MNHLCVCLITDLLTCLDDTRSVAQPNEYTGVNYESDLCTPLSCTPLRVFPLQQMTPSRSPHPQVWSRGMEDMMGSLIPPEGPVPLRGRGLFSQVKWRPTLSPSLSSVPVPLFNKSSANVRKSRERHLPCLTPLPPPSCATSPHL